MIAEPSFPPLFSGQALDGTTDPFEKACVEAIRGCDAGLVVHNVQTDQLRGAIVFSPDVPLKEAVAMLPLCGIGFQNALGALAPPEVAVHLDWDGVIRVNGATCGRLRMAASDADPDALPDWLVIGLEVTVLPENDAPGETPDRTALYNEGCAEVDLIQLLEAWVKHTLVWINRWTDDGVAPLHQEWRGLAHGIGEPHERDGEAGIFLGVDEHFGMLLRQDDTTRLFPLTTLLEDH